MLGTRSATAAASHSPTNGLSAGAARRKGGLAAHLSLGAAPLLALTAAGGALLVALGNNAARDGAGEAQLFFWSGLAVIYMPIVFRLLSTSASRAERISLVLILGVSLFVVKVLHSPASFDLHDELATWRQTNDLLQTGHFFSSNPLVEGYAGYPSLEATTAALVQLARFSIFHGGLIVVGLARVTLMFALFVFLERVSRSSRGAGIGVALYACNPSFLYFDSQFGYESLALPIAAAMLLVIVYWMEQAPQDRQRIGTGLVGAMVVLACTLTITHHMTSYALLAFLVVWAAFTAWSDRPTAINVSGGTETQVTAGGAMATPRTSLLTGPVLPALILAATIGIWLVFVAGRVTAAELGGTFSGMIDSIVGLVSGGTGPKTLFQSSGQTNSFAARVLAVGSVVPLLILLPLGLWRTWRGPDSNPLWRTLCVVGVFYPLTLGLRLTLAGTETSQRASEFVFLGLAFFAAVLIDRWRWHDGRFTRTMGTLGLALVATVIFLGGFVVGESPVTRQPGPFLISAEARSVSAQGIAAAQFAADNLPAGSRILIDRPNATFMASYGRLDPILGRVDGIPLTEIFFSKTFTRTDRQLIKDGHIRYIVVDRRLSQSLPVMGIYFERYEPNAYNHKSPISHAALSKFHLTEGLSRIYSNGPIVIYDTSGVR